MEHLDTNNVFLKFQNNWVVKKIAAAKYRKYLLELLKYTVVQQSNGSFTLPDIGDVTVNIAAIEKPSKQGAINSMRTRFKV